MTQKQTVYLPVNDDSETVIICEDIGKLEKINGYFFTPEQLNEYTQSVIKQALETAAEKATLEHKEYQVNGEYNSQNLGQEICIDCEEPYRNYVSCDKQSITNTFEETYNKLKV